MHLYCAAPLKECIKKDVVMYVKGLDALYNNVSNLAFSDTSAKTATKDYMDLANLTYTNFNNMVANNQIQLTYNTVENPVPVSSRKYLYARYLVAFFSEAENGDWGAACEELWAAKNPEPAVNDGSDPSLYVNNTDEDAA